MMEIQLLVREDKDQQFFNNYYGLDSKCNSIIHLSIIDRGYDYNALIGAINGKISYQEVIKHIKEFNNRINKRKGTDNA